MVPVGGHGNPCLGSLIASSKTLESFALPSHPPWINVNCMSMLHTHNTLVLIRLLRSLCAWVAFEGGRVLTCVPSIAPIHPYTQSLAKLLIWIKSLILTSTYLFIILFSDLYKVCIRNVLYLKPWPILVHLKMFRKAGDILVRFN